MAQVDPESFSHLCKKCLRPWLREGMGMRCLNSLTWLKHSELNGMSVLGYSLSWGLYMSLSCFQDASHQGWIYDGRDDSSKTKQSHNAPRLIMSPASTWHRFRNSQPTTLVATTAHLPRIGSFQRHCHHLTETLMQVLVLGDPYQDLQYPLITRI